MGTEWTPVQIGRFLHRILEVNMSETTVSGGCMQRMNEFAAVERSSVYFWLKVLK